MAESDLIDCNVEKKARTIHQYRQEMLLILKKNPQQQKQPPKTTTLAITHWQIITFTFLYCPNFLFELRNTFYERI